MGARVLLIGTISICVVPGIDCAHAQTASGSSEVLPAIEVVAPTTAAKPTRGKRAPQGTRNLRRVFVYPTAPTQTASSGMDVDKVPASINAVGAAQIARTGSLNIADALRKHGAAIMEQINALQQFNRRILEKLRPVGLAELGLREALGVLLRLWRESRPDVTIDANIACAPGETGEVSDLTVYRVVQEALTNAFRHADATSVSVTVEQAAGMYGNRGCALVRVSDNGRGLAPDHKSGFGLIGMRERILALGGTLNVVSGDGGVTVEAIVPHGSHH